MIVKCGESFSKLCPSRTLPCNILFQILDTRLEGLQPQEMTSRSAKDPLQSAKQLRMLDLEKKRIALSLSK